MKTTRILGLAGLLVVLAFLFWIFQLTSSSPALPPLPKPNGYDDFIIAGQRIIGNLSNYRDLPREELEALIRTNQEPLQWVRLGLSRECRVPIEFTESYAGAHVAELRNFKLLVSLLGAEGCLAELALEPGEAARNYLEVIRLGQEMSRGGLMIDKLVARAGEAIGVKRLSEMKQQLNAEQSRQIIQGLESIEAQEEPVDNVVEREHRWSRKTYRLRGLILRLLHPQMEMQTDQRFVEGALGSARKRRVLLIELALSAYEQEKGRKPKSLSDLAPAYLRRFPLDPGTGAPMAYSR